MWKEALGVEVKLAAVEFKSLFEDIDRRDIDMYRLSWVGAMSSIHRIWSSSPFSSPIMSLGTDAPTHLPGAVLHAEGGAITRRCVPPPTFSRHVHSR
jgi:hypothetical protein